MKSQTRSTLNVITALLTFALHAATSTLHVSPPRPAGILSSTDERVTLLAEKLYKRSTDAIQSLAAAETTLSALDCGTPDKLALLALISTGDVSQPVLDYVNILESLSKPSVWDHTYTYGHFTISYMITGEHSIYPLSDTDSDGTPDYVETVADALETSLTTMVNTFGFASPSSSSIPVHIFALPAGLGGQTTRDSLFSDLLIELNVSNTGGYIKHVCAHEVFHAIQYQYWVLPNAAEEWISEGTAEWMADAVFDDVNAYLDRVKYCIKNLHWPLNDIPEEHPEHPYDTVLYWKFLSEHYGKDGSNQAAYLDPSPNKIGVDSTGVDIIRELWEISIGDNHLNGIAAVDFVLHNHGASFESSFTSWTYANFTKDLGDPYAYGFMDYLEDETLSYGEMMPYDSVYFDPAVQWSVTTDGNFSGTYNGVMNQWSAQYYRLQLNNAVGSITLHFAGSDDGAIFNKNRFANLQILCVGDSDQDEMMDNLPLAYDLLVDGDNDVVQTISNVWYDELVIIVNGADNGGAYSLLLSTTGRPLYTVTFIKNGGLGGSDNVSVAYGVALPTATAPVRDGFAFCGYYDVNGKQYYTASMTSACNWDLIAGATLYAKWVSAIYVDSTRPDNTGNGTSWGTAKKTIQAAIDASADGNTILVAAGIYPPIITGNKSLRIESICGAIDAVIDGGGTQRCALLADLDAYTAGEWWQTNTVLIGFTMRNGYVIGSEWDLTWSQCGGGALGGTLDHCILRDNVAVGGAGGGGSGGVLIYCNLQNNSAFYGGGADSSTLNHCTIRQNTTTTEFSNWGGGGGAIWSVLDHCILEENSAESGSGANNSVLNNCTIRGNNGVAVYECAVTNCTLSGNSGYYGGAASGGTLSHCVISQNSAWLGGGSFNGTLEYCIITNNTAQYEAGGVYYGILNNCLISGNIAVESLAGGTSGGSLNNCTVTGNTSWGGSGVAFGSSYEGNRVCNSVVWDNFNHAGILDNFYCDWSGSFEFVSCCSFPLPPGTGNTPNAPLFVNPSTGDYRLQSMSPCVDAGDNVFASGIVDILGSRRVQNGRVDIGAYETPALPVSVLVTFASDGATVLPQTATYLTDGTYGTLPLAVREGYEFAGWWTCAIRGAQITASTYVLPRLTTLYARWNKTVTFNARGGSVTPAFQTFVINNEFGLLPVPTRGGWTFDGWWTGLTEESRIIETNLATDNVSVLYAHWIKVTNDAFANAYAIDVDCGAALGTANGATREAGEPNHHPSGFYGYHGNSVWWSWTALRNGLARITVDETIQSDTLTCIGVYTGEAVSSLTPIVRELSSCRFIVESGVTYHIAVSDDTSFVLSWLLEDPITVLFDSNGGTPITTAQLYLSDESYGTLPLPMRDGYDFAGWWTSQVGGSLVTYASAPLPSVPMLYAHWSVTGVPANDLFEEAIPIDGSNGSTAGSSVGASIESYEPKHGDHTGGASVWWSWSAPATGLAYVTAAADSRQFYAMLGVYCGTSVTSLLSVAQDYYREVNYAYTCVFPVAAGTTYHIAVDGENAHSGLVVLTWRIVSGLITVDFDYNVGDGVSTQYIYTIGGTYGTFPSPPIRHGYVFDGWATTDHPSQRFFWDELFFDESLRDVSSIVLDTVTTLYARWSMRTILPSWLASNGFGWAIDNGYESMRQIPTPNNKGTSVWHDYVTGCDPNEPTDLFRARIATDSRGQPIVTWMPDLGAARSYTVYGKHDLTQEKAWDSPPTQDSRFFRVGVFMP